MTGWRVWWYFVAFFAFVAAVNAAMVVLAIRTHSGVVTEHSYEKGLAYNDVVQAEEKQEALGWNGTIYYQNGLLRFTLHDQNNDLLNLEKTTVTITRPTQQGMDFTVELKGAETAVDFPANGLWQVRIDAIHKGVHYQQFKRIVVE